MATLKTPKAMVTNVQHINTQYVKFMHLRAFPDFVYMPFGLKLIILTDTIMLWERIFLIPRLSIIFGLKSK